MGKKASPNFESEPGPVLHTARWRFGDFVLDERKRELSVGPQIIPLEPKPLNMLMLMLRHPGELITKNDLIEALWTGRIVTDSVVTNCATKLRNALGEGQSGAELRNIHGYGYRLDAVPVLEHEQPAATALPRLAPGLPVPMREHWLLEARLGQSGETWRARHHATGDQRVFKFATTPQELSALKREVTLYRLLRQSIDGQILPLLDWQFDEPPWYLELPYCPLGSLQEYLQAMGGPQAIALKRRIEWLAQLAETVGQIHSVGIIHKDLKPSNVLVTTTAAGEDALLLTDFGAGRVLDLQKLEALAITQLGFTQFVDGSGSGSCNGSTGTPLYYAPEVLARQPATLRSDIYALGVICFQLVVGDMRRLFTPDWGASVADPLLREDIALACASDPEQRLGDARELARRLRSLPERRLEAEQKAAAEQQAAATALALQKAEARRRSLQWAAAALALGLVSSLVLFWQAQVARIAADQSALEARNLSQFLLDDVLRDVSAGDRSAQLLTVQELLNAARDSVKTRFLQQPALRAAVRVQLARAYAQLGLASQARVQAEQALQDTESLGASGVELGAEATAIVLDEAYGDGLLPSYLPRYSAIAERISAKLPAGSPQYQRLQWQLANAESDIGNAPAAVARMDRLLQASEALAISDPKSLASMRLSRARMLIYLERFDEARKQVRDGRPGLVKALGAMHLQNGRGLLMEAEADMMLGDFAGAQDCIDQAGPIVEAWEKKPGDYSLLRAMMQTRLALERQHPDAAEQALLHFDETLAAGEEPAPTMQYIGLYYRARIAEQRNLLPEAIAQVSAAIDAAASYVGPQSPRFLGMQLSRAEWQCRLPDFEACKASLMQMKPDHFKPLPPEHSAWRRYRSLQQQLPTTTTWSKPS